MKTIRRPTILVLLLLVIVITLSNAEQVSNTDSSSVAEKDLPKTEKLDEAECDATTTDQEGNNGTKDDGSGATDTVGEESNDPATDPPVGGNKSDADKVEVKEEDPVEPVQVGPFIDLLGTKLLSMNMVDKTHAKMELHYTNEALSGKKVVGLYFSADWCGPCRQFTPELVSFYNKMNSRRGKENQFEIVWVSSCRDMESFGQYFTHMNWLALPPEEATGPRGKMLASKYKVKGIPHLALLDEVGNIITLEGRTKVPQDRTGLGFPWRNPLSTIYITLIPKSLRFLLKTRVDEVKHKIVHMLKGGPEQQVVTA